MADSGGRTIGRDDSQGPGWWLASDGKWYPPELSPENRAKKKKKKAASDRSASGTSTAGSGRSAKARPSSSHGAGKVATAKQAARADASSPDEATALHFDDDAEPTDQIVARRIQAREQHLLLADARQQAALRALTTLGVDHESELVSVGSRTIDDRVADAPVVVPTPSTSPSPAPTESDFAPSTIDAPEVVVAPDEPDGPDPADGAHASRSPAAVAPRADPTDLASPKGRDEPPAEADVVPSPHQPTKRPEPAAAPMGTEIPFMEVRGSALGTDIERIGERILIFANRVELRDRGNSVKQTIAYEQLAGVVIQKKIMGPTLIIESTDGQTMTAKALRPELATGAKAMIDKHARRHLEGHSPSPDDEPAMAMADSAPTATVATPAPTPALDPQARASSVVEPPEPTPARMPHKHVLAAMIDELHAAGILTVDERTEKLALLEIIGRD